jgi:hypothetical protein
MDRPIMCSLFMLKGNKHLNRVLETLPVPQVYFYHRASWHVVLTTHIPSQFCAVQSPNMSGHKTVHTCITIAYKLLRLYSSMRCNNNMFTDCGRKWS